MHSKTSYTEGEKRGLTQFLNLKILCPIVFWVVACPIYYSTLIPITTFVLKVSRFAVFLYALLLRSGKWVPLTHQPKPL